MLAKSIYWLSFVSLLTATLLQGTTQIARSMEEQDSISMRSIQNINPPARTGSFLEDSNFFSLPISQSNTPFSQNTTIEPPNLRRAPVGGEEEFKPQKVPLNIPGLEQIEQQEARSAPYKAAPSISIITPSGYGADWGTAGIGIGFQQRTRFTETSDAVVGLGFGLGDAQNLVGIQVGLALVDVSDPFRDGSISFKVHRRLPYDFSLAIGVQGGVTFGVTDGGSSVYGVVSRRFALKRDVREPFSEIYTSLGIGGGQFRSESDINEGVESVGLFGSVAVRVLEPMSLITEWTGQDLTIGISWVPFRDLPLVVVPAVTDVTGTAGDGVRFLIGVGYGFSF
ncbi:hypothetical protein NIES593_03780 [Hydrococcus rivularis NIES-593]|uniref:Outer membrane protein beta-barrel domain-containing protein n=1 Tax=Hydrococcus rivularis NIES-593 TaxID=1921803 RepID=A0A1U7HRK3_9CYAN|nr:hypothetical protein [Hydrococcus rivularis]OKH26201.1 hypothetical protein NIES593_03780 [Hydrococcus rivularis NIES-593]